MDKNEIRLGIFGLGSVGEAVVTQLLENRGEIEALTGKKIIPYKACVKNPDKKRALPASDLKISADPDFILKDENVNLCIELIGGVSLAKNILLTCFKKNIPVITANKHLLAEYGTEIFTAAADSKTYLGFEAAVCGGMPILKIIRENFAGEKIKNIVGILNGTSNYILSSMALKGLDFDHVLETAHKLGYAEADPSFDVDGIDAAHKLIILMNLAYKRVFNYKNLRISGIRNVEISDIKHIEDMGYCLKLIGKATSLGNEQFEASLSPALLHKNHLLASVNDSYNAVMIEGHYTENTMFYGRGAGGKATGNSVISDLIDYLCDRNSGELPSKQDNQVLNSSTEHEYYLSFKAPDKIGTLAKIADIFSNYGISIMKIIQDIPKTDNSIHADVIFISHHTTEEKISGVTEKLNASGLLLKPPNCYPIID